MSLRFFEDIGTNNIGALASIEGKQASRVTSAYPTVKKQNRNVMSSML